MAFAASGLRLISVGADLPLSGTVADTAGQNTQKIWSYVTGDAAATVDGAGYFNSAGTLLSKGDIIFGVAVVGGTPVLKARVVTAAASGAVSTALQTTT